MHPRLLCLLTALLLSFGQSAHALTIEAEGRALINNRDLESARQEALRNATQQGMLQAGAYVSSTQTINQGVLSIDNLRVRTLGNLTNVRIIDEQVRGEMLRIRISADVSVEESCERAGPSGNYLKSAAIAAFPLLDRSQANQGALHNVEQAFPQALAEAITHAGDLRAMGAGNLVVTETSTTAPTRQDSFGAITQTLERFKELDVQFIVSGVVRDIGMFDASRNRDNNLFVDWYDQLDYLGDQHLRNFAVDVFIHDGFTGALLFNRSYRQAGLWNYDKHFRAGFGSPAFSRSDYGHKVATLIDQVAREVNDQLKCEPFRARIVATDRNSITFNAGSVVGVQPGDSLTVYRKSTFYDHNDQAHIRLENTRRSLVVNDVHPRFSVGNIATQADQLNIQQDDVLMAW